MIDASRIVAVTLAAGEALRFGSDKLAAPLGPGNVLDASLAALDGFGFGARMVVLDEARARDFSRPDIGIIVNRSPSRGMGHSLALAAAAAVERGTAALLVTLGDMPCLTRASIARLLAKCEDRPDLLAAMQAGQAPPGPPALFGRRWFAVLTEEDGDSGARALLRDPANHAIILPLAEAEARDIDTPADLAALNPSPR